MIAVVLIAHTTNGIAGFGIDTSVYGKAHVTVSPVFVELAFQERSHSPWDDAKAITAHAFDPNLAPPATTFYCTEEMHHESIQIVDFSFRPVLSFLDLAAGG
ncbi:hypothetical protein [Bradyrhizobium iriomotense]|uniref:hypothetical protein n=1 Tax=Bradyrhizobium iriomotense TaxID=441950 RepID=UPI001B8A2ECA|nr:hypothetical protein [Bradyrhizobium iriomotense]MBR1128929.1 hypothetical protein [Bradyrhizobium iriomotense]